MKEFRKGINRIEVEMDKVHLQRLLKKLRHHTKFMENAFSKVPIVYTRRLNRCVLTGIFILK